MTGDEDARRALEQVASEHGARILASLIAACDGDFQLAEDAYQEALLAGLEHWPRRGIPTRPDAWLISTARRKAIDQLRRGRNLARKQEQIGHLLTLEQAAGPDEAMDESEPTVPDNRLELIFTCCHPALALEAQVGLTLRTIAGLDTPEIARAFLVSPETMAKRLTRARSKIRDARIPYRVPRDAELPDRLAGVLAVIYLIFNEGYVSSGGDSLFRPSLCNEAIRLGRLLAGLMPDEPEALGLLALMLLIDSRRRARTNSAGEIVTLDEQDRSLWDRERIAEGAALVQKALRMRRPGPYQVQAAIAAVHAEAEEPDDTDWRQIVLLYDRLLQLQPSPVVELNRAVAVSMAFGPEAGLQELDALDIEATLCDYYPAHAARADFLRRAGRIDESREAYERALSLCHNVVEQRYLRRRLQELDASGTAQPHGYRG